MTPNGIQKKIPSARNTATVFIHEPHADTRGMARAAIVNRRANGGRGLAVAMRFSRQTLPWLIQWRNPVPIEYVHGLEPSNGWVMGRDLDRKARRLVFMRPGEVRRYRIELDFLSGRDELSKIKI